MKGYSNDGEYSHSQVKSKFPRGDEIKWERRKQERKNTMMREEKINRRWILLLGQVITFPKNALQKSCGLIYGPN